MTDQLPRIPFMPRSTAPAPEPWVMSQCHACGARRWSDEVVKESLQREPHADDCPRDEPGNDDYDEEIDPDDHSDHE